MEKKYIYLKKKTYTFRFVLSNFYKLFKISQFKLGSERWHAKDFFY